MSTYGKTSSRTVDQLVMGMTARDGCCLHTDPKRRYHRHALFYPLPEEDRKRRKGVRMYGHTDYGITTLLFSVPVTALHIWTRQEKWQPVKVSLRYAGTV